jgi:DNA-binding GntR family transcriptional regulator
MTGSRSAIAHLELASSGHSSGRGDAVPVGKFARSLPELVAEQVVEQIVAGRLRPGDRLKELALAQEQAVSRTTIREALAILERWHFVQRIPRVGARVIEFGAEDIGAQYEIRAALLSLAAARCAKRDDAVLRARLSALIAEMERVVATGDGNPDAFAMLSIEGAQLLLHESGNRYLPDVFGSITGTTVSRLVRGRSLAFRTPERRRESAEDWRAIAQAIENGDPGAAEDAVRKMVARSARGVIQALAASVDDERAGRPQRDAVDDA